jgi:hypothetical protein
LVLAEHETLQNLLFHIPPLDGKAPELLFTDNETNNQRVFGSENPVPYVKDAFDERIVHGNKEAVSPRGYGTKLGAWYQLNLAPGEQKVLKFRLTDQKDGAPFDANFDRIFAQRIAEADDFYNNRVHRAASPERRLVARQAYAGLLWSKQFYHYVVADWLDGDPSQPPPPAGHNKTRNTDWRHFFARDVLSMPDKWEYPWFAAWDLSFHTVQLAYLDPNYAKEQLLLMLREWYTHPNGQLPAYEFAFRDVNPPVHAWACWRVYKITGASGSRDRTFLRRVFSKLLINFTWWVNRKDIEGKHVFAGGFLGLDNIGVFDRSRPLPNGGRLEQADGTAWMAFYCGTMLSIAIELASEDAAFEDIASKFFEHFVSITDAMNSIGGFGLWNEQIGFYCDQLLIDGHCTPLTMRSVVGIIPLFAVEVLDSAIIERMPGFKKRMDWFLKHRQDLARNISYMQRGSQDGHLRYLLAIPTRERLAEVLRYVLDEKEFLSPYGIRSLSRIYKDKPFQVGFGGDQYTVRYEPGESQTGMFGGNSNWRGPVWMPINYLLIESLERYHHFYGEGFQIECPTGSGKMMNLWQVAAELKLRLTNLFLPDKNGKRPINAGDRLFDDEGNKDLVLFYEYFHGDNGRGCGASHQTGWTALAGHLIEDVGQRLEKAAQSSQGRRAGGRATPAGA